MLEKILESLLDSKEIKPVNPKGNQSWIFIGRTDAEAETPILWPPDVKSWLIWKDPDAGKDWRQKERRTTEPEMVGWHHQLNGHEFKQATGVGEEQGKPGILHPMGSQRVGHEWANEQQMLFKGFTIVNLNIIQRSYGRMLKILKELDYHAQKRFKILISLNHLIVVGNNYHLHHFCLYIHF